jgi:nicotinate phosphoribosyltransferase
LDGGGLHDVSIFASGNLDEYRIAALLAQGAPINGFGVGTALDTSSDVPALDAVYKLQSYAGVPRRKRSEGKATWPGIKQVWRRLDGDGKLLADEIRLLDEPAAGVPLLQPCMRGGRRLSPHPGLQSCRECHAAQMRSLPKGLRRLDAPPAGFSAQVSAGLRTLAADQDTQPH